MQNRSCAGVALVEVLVAMLVLAAGVLGVVALQSSSVRLNQSAQQKTHVLLAVNSLAELLRADATRARTGAYAGDCEQDLLADWTAQLQQASASALCPELSWDAATGFYTIALAWSDERLTAEQAVVVQVRP
ncbi:type IV pilus modification protein PilV [Rheinheimera sp.]|uniref:type IV pilus modification protein PilV n=1 Tax=Rheinheimera sp. TaxID=1869214 RepID=UPI00307F8CA0